MLSGCKPWCAIGVEKAGINRLRAIRRGRKVQRGIFSVALRGLSSSLGDGVEKVKIANVCF